MADVQFDEDQEFARSAIVNMKEKPYFARLVLATGIVSTEEQANYILLSIALITIVIAFALPFFIGRSSATPPPVNQIIYVAGPDAVPGKN